ncbi:putative aminopeptidase W07G4.4 isoform X2 [Panulirus ornatus]|uniref:putative aminopeptidase W07G4.4 isoform X2 n=1 Tax=Panulirus ornatus TaxID=150431 RepID=UPI003A86EF1E
MVHVLKTTPRYWCSISSLYVSFLAKFRLFSKSSSNAREVQSWTNPPHPRGSRVLLWPVSRLPVIRGEGPGQTGFPGNGVIALHKHHSQWQAAPLLHLLANMTTPSRIPCEVRAETSVSASGYDGIILVSDSLDKLKGTFDNLLAPLKAQAEIDETLVKDGACLKVDVPANRLVYAPTGPLNRDYDDVRRFADAAASGIKRGLKVGIKRPLLVRAKDQSFPHADLVTLLGALHALYVPLEVREDVPAKASKASVLGFIGDSQTVQLALALESGRFVARDIGGSDPERMAPPKVEEYVRNVFQGTNISVEVVSDDAKLCKDYPLFSAVNRCAKGVPRHKGRVIYLTYNGAEPIQQTLMLVGKGVTYDTGGADIKAGGVMAGMHRDKCGSAAVAGFMQILAKLQPPNIKVIGAMAMVRNSVGSECYVSDEIITSRAGVRVRVGNTDAEGRMAMADVLCHMKEMAVKEVNPYLMTIATLTGHCVLAYGEAYTAVMDNGPAHLAKMAQSLQTAGEEVADPFEISSIRREDYDFHCGKSEYEDVLQCNNAPSTRTPRGHQTPSAFLVMSSGLDKHGKDSSQPLKYSHLDVAGSSGPFPGIPTGAPILALTKVFIPNAF